MLLQRWEAEIPRITTRSWVRHSHHWVTREQDSGNSTCGEKMSLKKGHREVSDQKFAFSQRDEVKKPYVRLPIFIFVDCYNENLTGSKKIFILINLNLLRQNDNFRRTRKKSLLKTMWEKKKMLVTSIFFFSHNVFYLMKHNFRILSNIWFVVCKCF